MEPNQPLSGTLGDVCLREAGDSVHVIENGGFGFADAFIEFSGLIEAVCVPFTNGHNGVRGFQKAVVIGIVCTEVRVAQLRIAEDVRIIGFKEGL